MCDPSLSGWFKKGWTLGEALTHRFETHAASISNAFSQDEGRGTDEGFSLGLWNGETQEAASSVSLSCGAASVWVPNSCVVRLPGEGLAAERLLQAPVLARILRAMVLAWEPESGVATSHGFQGGVSESVEADTFVGWVTYVSHRRGQLPSLPAPVRVEPVEDKGSLVILNPERISSDDVELARTVAGLFDKAGLLGPLKPWEG
jgi:hypothetical protein